MSCAVHKDENSASHTHTHKFTIFHNLFAGSFEEGRVSG